MPPSIDIMDPGSWLLGSLLTSMLALNLAWLLARGAGAALRHGLVAPALAWLLAASFLLLPPVVALRMGVLSPYVMGLAEVDWLNSLGAGGLLAGTVVALALLGWLIYRRLEPRAGTPTEGAIRWIRPLDAALAQWHWAFYRAAAIGWLSTGALATALADAQARLAASHTPAGPLAGQLLAWATVHGEALGTSPLYWGCWLGLGLAGLEAWANPFFRADLRSAGRMEAAARAVLLAVATTALFILTRNFWLCLACHVVLETAIAGWFPLEDRLSGE